MISQWTWPAYVGIVLGVVVFVVVLIPVLIVESRRFGQIRPTRLVGAAMVAVYVTALAAYTLLPLPDAAWCAAHPAPGRNLHPFLFVTDIARAASSGSVRRLLTSFVFLQVAFNVLLFVPWGALVRRFFGRGIAFASASGLAASLVIEVVQGTGAFGILPCAYRVADVDDVILNTVGALVGAVLMPLFLWWLPDPRAAEKTRARPRPVTRTRRLVGMLIDLAVYTAVPAVLAVGYRAVRFYLLGQPLSDQPGWWDSFLPQAITLAAVVLAPAFVGAGASLGQHAVWLVPEWPDHPRRRSLVRLATGFGGYATLSLLASLPPLQGSGWAAGAATAADLLAAAALVAVLVDSSARGLSVRAAGGTVADARASHREGDRVAAPGAGPTDGGRNP